MTTLKQLQMRHARLVGQHLHRLGLVTTGVLCLVFAWNDYAFATVISGPIAVHLNTRHEGTDGFWAATVTDVDPDSGNSFPLSTGWVEK